jgi:energy-coupling factor transport system substrate-specific component
MKRAVSLLFALLLLPAVFSSADYGESAGGDRIFLSEYVQELYGEDSAIPMIEVKSILQTSDMHLWIAGYQGLMRYNGSESKIFTPEDGFPSFKVNVLFEDSSGRLWIGTNDSGIVYFKNNSFTVYGLAEGLPSASVRDIAECSAGFIYIATAGGIALITPDGELILHPELHSVFSIQLAYAGNGSFICLLNDGRIVTLDNQKMIRELPADHFGAAAPRCIYLRRDGVFFVGTDSSEVYIADSLMSVTMTVETAGLSPHNDFFEDSEKRLWLVADNGFGYFENHSFIHVDGLIMSNRLETLYEDYEGNLWLGSSRSGLLQLVRGKFTNISFLASLPNLVVNSTAFWNNELYIASDTGLLVLKNYLQTENALTELLDGIRIRSLFIDSKNQLWISTFSEYGVIIARDDGSFVSVNEESGLPSSRVRCVTEAPNGDIYVGLTGGISVIRGGEIIRNYTGADGLSNDMILSLCIDKDGNIVAGSDGGGIYVISGDEIINFNESDGLAAGVILRAVSDGNGIWISTGNAVCYMDDTGIRVIDKLILYDDSVFDIKIIGDEIWFIRSKSISIGSIGNLLSDDELVITNLRRHDGLSSTVTANSWNALTNDGILYISTTTGVFSINTRAMYKNETVPVAVISALFADGNHVSGGADGSITINSDTQRIDINISLLSFASENGTVSFMLEGFDEEFITTARSDSPSVSYTNLDGGRYTFHLFGTNADGLQSEIVSLTIYKEYTLLEMPFVRMLMFVVGAGLAALCIWAFVTHKTRGLVKQRQEYKDIAGQIISVFSTVIDMKEEWLHGHSLRVAEYSRKIGQRLALEEHELETLYYAALLHDIGNIAVPASILNKPGTLTEEEFEMVKLHVTIGTDLLAGVNILGDIALGAKYHHERVDGRGYTTGLIGDEIPLIGRIIGVCDAFDSMLSERPFRRAMPVEKAQSELVSNAGKQFDAKITAALISLISEGEVPLC